MIRSKEIKCVLFVHGFAGVAWIRCTRNVHQKLGLLTLVIPNKLLKLYHC